jgi:hypothetical protein
MKLTPKENPSSGFYNSCNAMVIADYFAIGILIYFV